MKLLVVGSLPPPATARSRALLAEVVRQRSEGATVQVLSPTDYSVAHRYLNSTGPISVVEIGLAARHADSVVVQLQPGLLFDESASRTGRAIGLAALATVLRGVRGDITVRLHSMHDLAHGAGGRAAEALWAVADRIEVGDEPTRAALRAVVGETARDKIMLALAPPELTALRGDSSALGGDATLGSVTAVVRARAAGERLAQLSERADRSGQVQARPRVALWQWSPRPGAGVPDWAPQSREVSAHVPVIERAARSVLYAADARPFTRPLARGARIARRGLTKI
ncbi:MAG: hypothetical protein ACYCSF_01960 [Acidimicrobiales bacterium]